MKCERLLPNSKRRCERPVVAFVMGQNVCADHDQSGSANCSHSLSPSGRCAHCGARI